MFSRFLGIDPPKVALPAAREDAGDHRSGLRFSI
jgi:hypothetical protein